MTRIDRLLAMFIGLALVTVAGFGLIRLDSLAVEVRALSLEVHRLALTSPLLKEGTLVQRSDSWRWNDPVTNTVQVATITTVRGENESRADWIARHEAAVQADYLIHPPITP